MSKVVEKEVVKKGRMILGKKLSDKLTNEMIATIEVITKNASKKAVNVPFLTLFNQFCIELALISKSQSNRKTRFRRLLTRNLEAILLKDSLQSAKFNIKANIKGITIKTKSPLEYKSNGDVVISTSDTNFYSFKRLKNISTIQESEISKELFERVANLKK